ncbi:GNAT family N-acetyltransferase [Nocardioides sp. CER19]|uniref:GNAT family N-acetyltransferase n=1 Tax=Nocardioides sp. CER19 TaxID=3038538 RepID=UPI00244C8267|nr:GNAT family N-acetyltransferase [Nocardioides sp. CER19]MDH2416563.1 hypothetical protein [Nocardioides sp. CER19]
MTGWPPPAAWRGAVALEPLTAALVDLDTSAYAASPVAVQRHSAGRWPARLTREDNLALIAHHEAEHRAGEAFAYAILTDDRARELGCAYLRPLDRFLERTGTRLAGPPEGAAIATFWLLDDASARPDELAVVTELLAWADAWAVARPVFRCLPEETASVAALEALGLTELAASHQELPYRWFAATGPQPAVRPLAG